MNKRQKKKRYKKLYGHNPPKRYKVDDILITANDLEGITTAIRDLNSRIQYAFGIMLEELGKVFMKAGQTMKENTLEQKGKPYEQSNFNWAIDERTGDQNVSGWKTDS